MKKRGAVLVVAVVCFAAGRLWNRAPVNAKGAGGGGEPTLSCGNVNGDERVDLSDAVYLLNHLFLGGPAPVCRASCAELIDCNDSSGPIVFAAGDFNGDGWCDLTLMNRDSNSITYFRGTGEGLEAAGEIAIGDRSIGLTTNDFNGDGLLDLGTIDSEWCVTVLFGGLNGLTPSVTLCPPSCALPDTGQTTCYDQSGNEISCDSETCPGQDGFYRTGCPRETRFVESVNDNGESTVTDTCTGLMWQKDTADVNNDQQIDSNDRLSWCEALAYCQDLEFAGHDDWRLPNVRELQSIVDYGRWNPAIDPVFGVVSSWNWSSTSYANAPPDAWIVNFSNGYFDVSKDNGNYVRAVRTAP